MKVETWLQGCGLAILLTLNTLWVHISPKRADLYHSLLPVNHIYWGLVVDLAVVCLLATALVFFIESLPPKIGAGKPSLWWSILGALLIASVRGSMIRLVWVSGRSLTPELTFIIFACCGIFVAIGSSSLYGRIVHAIRLTFTLLGICILWIMPQLLYMAIHREPHEQSGFVRPVPHASLPQDRIVWVVFDELSYDQIVDHRQAGINLPAFDRLRAESLIFSHVQPAGYFTGLVLPSLLTGKTVISERSNLDGDLSVKTESGWAKLNADQSIFADVHAKGWSTGVAGWYNPYCRTYGAELDRCDWIYSAPTPGGFDPRKSVWTNAFAPIRQLFLEAIGRTDPAYSDTAAHTSDYRQLMDWSHQLLADENTRFVFLHLPIPHPPNIYSRQTGTLGATGSYLDNLVLADSALSEVMQWIAATKSAHLTTLVICSDHSWRVPMWSKNGIWTAEDERASQGKFDPRPVLMVHLPEEKAPYTISQPFMAIKEHDLIENLLTTEPTPQSLLAWISTQQ